MIEKWTRKEWVEVGTDVHDNPPVVVEYSYGSLQIRAFPDEEGDMDVTTTYRGHTDTVIQSLGNSLFEALEKVGQQREQFKVLLEESNKEIERLTGELAKFITGGQS